LSHIDLGYLGNVNVGELIMQDSRKRQSHRTSRDLRQGQNTNPDNGKFMQRQTEDVPPTKCDFLAAKSGKADGIAGQMLTIQNISHQKRV
jgi:hypothetical protein